jgi:tRNA(Arg) A34 adenosine deaminase TadA
MTSQGSAHARFQRAIKRGHLLNAETAARELGALSLSDSLALVLLYQRDGSGKFERAARRWVRRVQVDRSLRHLEVELLRAAMGALDSRFHDAALSVLAEACLKLRLSAPTIASYPSQDDLS